MYKKYATGSIEFKGRDSRNIGFGMLDDYGPRIVWERALENATKSKIGVTSAKASK